ncbi:hypothetical protein N9B48_00445 [bacterium]|nr:hypothetical protein [bacterium]
MKSLTRGARMLILVSQLIENCFGLIKQKLESIIVLLVLGFPMLGFAQESEFEFSATPLSGGHLNGSSDEIARRGNGFHQQLSQKHVSTPSLVSTLSIGKPEQDASPVVLLESLGAPKPPRDLLMPADPTTDSFGEPLVNDLRAEAVQRNPESGVVTANAEMSIAESPLSTSGSFMPIQEEAGLVQRPAARFTADSLRSELMPTWDRDQVESTAIQIAPPLNRPMQEVLMASQIPTHTNDEANSTAPQGQAGGVQLAGFTEPIYKKNKFIPATAKDLISRYSLERYENPLPGQPVNLVDLFRQPLTLDRRSLLVRQYWETYFDWANYVASEKYSQWLKQVPVPESSSEQALLAAVESVVANKVMAAEIQLLKSQALLAQFWPVPSQGSVNPIPNDLPLIQRYTTNYELYLSRQLVPPSFRGIDKVLPKMLALIEMRAEAVGYAKFAADRMLVPGEGMKFLSTLEAGKVLFTAERDLIASVVSYNRAIGDYALSVSTQPKSATEVVEMLIAKVAVNATPKSVVPVDVIPADVIPADVIPQKATPPKANLSGVSNSVISDAKSPTASIANAKDFGRQRSSGISQEGTTSVLQAKKDSRILDELAPPESNVLSDRQPPSMGGIAAQPASLPKVVESDAGFSLSPANKPPALKFSESNAPPEARGFKPPAGIKTPPPVGDNRFLVPPVSSFKNEVNSPVAPRPANGFQPFGTKGTSVDGASGSLKTEGFQPPKFSAPGFRPVNGN